MRLAQTGNRIGLHPQSWKTETAALSADLSRLPKALKEYAGLYREQGDAYSEHAATLDKARGIVLAAIRDLC